MSYRPKFDTTIQTKTESRNLVTWHTDYVDWDNYPFDTDGISGRTHWTTEQQSKWLEDQKAFLKTCEQPNAWVSNYGGWPRLWAKVVKVGMCSCWPHWRPRPTVLVFTHLGAEQYDWASITGAETREVKR